MEPDLKLNPGTEARRFAVVGKGEKLLEQVRRLSIEDKVKEAVVTYKELVAA